jgi:hypothetical protein
MRDGIMFGGSVVGVEGIEPRNVVASRDDGGDHANCDVVGIEEWQ